MSPWFRWRHDVSSPLGWGGLGIPIWEGTIWGGHLLVWSSHAGMQPWEGDRSTGVA